MFAYYFQLLDEKGPTGYCGMVVADSWSELFWAIDEFCDPYKVVVKEVKRGGYCKKVEVFGDKSLGSDEEIEIETSEHEFSEHEPFPLVTDGWQIPEWGDVV